MSRSLDDLDPEFYPVACQLIARACEVKIPVLIVDTLRTFAEHQENLRRRVSSTANSKHLPQPPHGKSLAIDVCPYEEYQLHGPDKLQWNDADPAWQVLGAIGESLGLRWGGRWARPHDLGHFEYVRPDP